MEGLIWKEEERIRLLAVPNADCYTCCSFMCRCNNCNGWLVIVTTIILKADEQSSGKNIHNIQSTLQSEIFSLFCNNIIIIVLFCVFFFMSIDHEKLFVLRGLKIEMAIGAGVKHAIFDFFLPHAFFWCNYTSLAGVKCTFYTSLV
jgi:hypothetical protein